MLAFKDKKFVPESLSWPDASQMEASKGYTAVKTLPVPYLSQ